MLRSKALRSVSSHGKLSMLSTSVEKPIINDCQALSAVVGGVGEVAGGRKPAFKGSASPGSLRRNHNAVSYYKPAQVSRETFPVRPIIL